MAKLALAIMLLALSACGDDDYYPQPREITQYILQNASNYEVTVEFLPSDGEEAESVVTPAGEELIFFEALGSLNPEGHGLGVVYPREAFDGTVQVIARFEGQDVLVFSDSGEFAKFDAPVSVSGYEFPVHQFTLRVTDSDIIAIQ